MTQKNQDDARSESLLSVQDLKKHFSQSEGFIDRLLGDQGDVHAVDGVSFSLHAEETLAVVGESGCGKSTLAKTIIKIHEPTEGRIAIHGDEIADLSQSEMRPYRRSVQMIFQDPLASLNPRQTVGEIIATPMKVHDIGTDKKDRRRRVESLLERVGLSAAYIDRYPHQFSGGQQQRIGIARALAVEPDVIIADEPVSALDVSVQAQILQLLKEIQTDMGLSILLISHDLSVVRSIADRVAVMYLGEFVETAPAEVLFSDPAHPYTEALLSAVPRIQPENRPRNRQFLEGVVPSPVDPPSGCRFHTRCPVVIPPDDWSESQELFRDVFTYRNRIVSDEVDIEELRNRTDTTDDSGSSELINKIVDEAFPSDIERLPSDLRDAVLSSASALIRGDGEQARNILSKEFSSPCERQIPQETRLGRDHEATCLRLEEHQRDPKREKRTTR